MSKDPFEELFGPDVHAEAGTPQPVPARERLAQEQAERVRTRQMPSTGAAAGAASERGRGPGAKPWIVVGVVALLALVASIVVLNFARGGESSKAAPTSTSQSEADGSQTGAQTDDATSDATGQPTATPSDANANGAADSNEATDPGDAAEQPEPEESEGPETNDVPRVDVGGTFSMPVADWGVTVDVSEKFVQVHYGLEGDNLVISSPLIDSLPAECSKEWGITRTGADSFVALKPAERCAAAPEVYDELWGLTDAVAKSAKPLGADD